MVELVTEHVFWSTPVQIVTAVIVGILLMFAFMKIFYQKTSDELLLGFFFILFFVVSFGVPTQYVDSRDKNATESVVAVEDAYGVIFNPIEGDREKTYVIPGEGLNLVFNDVTDSKTGDIYRSVKVARENDKITLFIPESDQSDSYIELPLVNN